MAIPQRNIVAPAKAWLYLSKTCHGEEGDAHGCREHDAEHCEDGYTSEYHGDKDETIDAVLCGGIHKDGNERFTGTEEEDGKEDPGCEIDCILLGMDVKVFFGVNVLVNVCISVHVRVYVMVGFVPPCPAQSPDKVDEAKGDKGPGSEVTPERFHQFQLFYRDAHSNADHSQYNRASDVAYPAENGNPGSLCQGPFSCLGHNDEGQIVVRAEECVKETDRGGRNQKNCKSGSHRRIIMALT